MELERQLGLRPGCGASGPVRVADIDLGLEQARIAVGSSEGRGFAEFTELGTYGVLLGSRSSAELRLLAGPLDPLLDEADELIATLGAFLRRNGQLEAAAAELGIHRHTMRNRMRRIGQLLAGDLNSADTRTQLWLAIKAWQLLASRKS